MISVVILTKNAEKTLLSVLEVLESFDVVIIDTGSSDSTLGIAKKFQNVRVFSYPFEGFGVLKNKGANHAKHDWILSLDSDELPSKELIDFLNEGKLDPNCIYSFPFHNYYKKKRIYGCGWHPESHLRLYHRKKTGFNEAFVHEKIEEKDLLTKDLPYPISHFSYLCIDDFIRKMQLYTTLFAEQNQGKKKSSFCKAFFHGLFAFFKTYILKRGFLNGKEGVVISWYNGSVSFIKYLKLVEKNSC